ncbi:hypothetical protein H4219_006133 [Mycoemilia scoparia]|uniref:Armadillo repeat-containing protein 8 n=1 Tax=Mycoemilia scoparia TaxID=417184 RepID=A0A9W7ZUD6_9FUNG|nr:hypothetical protein H4219_006133 [Mycoemilia scoparia]
MSSATTAPSTTSNSNILERHRNLSQKLTSTNPVEVHDTLCDIKNAIIGSNSKKKLYCQLDIIPKILSILATPDIDTQIRIQATNIISSLSHCKQLEVARTLVQYGVIDTLVSFIAPGSDTVLMTSALRALKALFVFKGIQVYESISSLVPYLLSIISNINLLCAETTTTAAATHSAATDNITTAVTKGGGRQGSSSSGSESWGLRIELAALVLAKVCNSEARQVAIINLGAVNSLVGLISVKDRESSNYLKLRIAGCKALSSLAYENAEIAQNLMIYSVNGGGGAASNVPLLDVLLELIKSTNEELRLNAARCLTNICHMVDSQDIQEKISLAVIPALIKLIKYTDVDINQVVQIFGYICHDREPIQMIAVNNGGLEALNQYLRKLDEIESSGDVFINSDTIAEKIKNILLTTGTITSSHEECRRKAESLGMASMFINKLEHKDPRIRTASCLCIRSLSRSSDLSRTKLPEAGVLDPLLKLLDDPIEDVRAMGVDTLTNFMQGGNPLRKVAVEKGVINKLIQSLNSSNMQLSKKALFTLKNMMCNSETELKVKIMETVGYDRIKDYVYGKDKDFQNLSAQVIRNMVCGSAEGVEAVLNAYAESGLMDIIQILITSKSDTILTDSFYIITNIAAIDEKYRDVFIRYRSILEAVLDNLSHPSYEVKLACVWCINNLTWNSNGNSTGLLKRAAILCGMGVREKLEAIQNELELDVNDQVKATLDQISQLESLQKSVRDDMSGDIFNLDDSQDCCDEGPSIASGLHNEDRMDQE